MGEVEEGARGEERGRGRVDAEPRGFKRSEEWSPASSSKGGVPTPPWGSLHRQAYGLPTDGVLSSPAWQGEGRSPPHLWAGESTCMETPPPYL